MAEKLKFTIIHPGELAAGIWSYTDAVTVEVESSDAGGDKGEFAEFLRECLAEWFDGAKVHIGEAPYLQEGAEE